MTSTTRPDDFARADYSCKRYTPGHQVHFIQARKSSEGPPGMAKVIETVDDDGTIRFTDGTTKWNHDVRRVKALFEHVGPDARLRSFNVLAIGSYLVCVSDSATRAMLEVGCPANRSPTSSRGAAEYCAPVVSCSPSSGCAARRGSAMPRSSEKRETAEAPLRALRDAAIQETLRESIDSAFLFVATVVARTTVRAWTADSSIDPSALARVLWVDVAAIEYVLHGARDALGEGPFDEETILRDELDLAELAHDFGILEYEDDLPWADEILGGVWISSGTTPMLESPGQEERCYRYGGLYAFAAFSDPEVDDYFSGVLTAGDVADTFVVSILSWVDQGQTVRWDASGLPLLEQQQIVDRVHEELHPPPALGEHTRSKEFLEAWLALRSPNAEKELRDLIGGLAERFADRSGGQEDAERRIRAIWDGADRSDELDDAIVAALVREIGGAR